MPWKGQPLESSWRKPAVGLDNLEWLSLFILGATALTNGRSSVDSTTTHSTNQPNWFKRHKVWTVIIVLAVIGILGNSADKPTASNIASNSPAPSQTPTPPPFDLPTFYAAIQNGMTKDQVIAAAHGTQPTSCTESETQGIGTTEFCDWSKGFNTVDVTLENGAVASKTKTGF